MQDGHGAAGRGEADGRPRPAAPPGPPYAGPPQPGTAQPGTSQPAGPPPPGGPPAGHGGLPACVRHPDRPTRLACTRCERPACPQCLQPASVGQHCVDCLAGSAGAVPRWRNVAGATRTGRPVIVPGLIAANVAVFVLTVVTAGSLNRNFASPLFAEGSLLPALVANGEYWRLLTSGFLHVGPLHLAFNMVALWIIGREVETVLGRARFGAVYAVSLLGGSAAVMLLSNPLGPTAGASGAVFGLMGALFVLLRRLKLPAGQVIGVIAINVVISFTIPQISWQGHLGGLLFGAAVTAALLYLGVRSHSRRQVQIVAVSGLALLALVLIGAGVVLV
ncbi:Membrane associated serine protease, rhomboid family [Pseudonocardia ammonioxydans]|uniref:Membrane associated serine protease, rhomboid family n=1 Tax=Pseudonocardia ammonioxydans TaxID=260086 RepID=A0A1I4WY59_PSUAM|nr:rhomboid family intramembrane serine protease [Pseudonocardia ammonioxydans]SFN17929.1 Membrane associated serine protease, rhomboid family [Pseudonocardia ammonioxydans]